MNLDKILLLALGVCIGGFLTSSLTPADSSIPPTRAFSTIFMAGQNITAGSYHDSFEVIIQGDLTSSISDDSITIKLKEFECPESTFVSGVHSNGTWICS